MPLYVRETGPCLDLAHPGSVGTGTVLRPSTLERYALDAGFAGLEVLPIEDFGFFRCYRLR